MTLRAALPPPAPTVDGSGDFWYGAPAAEFALAAGGVCVSPRLDHSVVRVSGPDAATFLQAQLITNLKQLDHAHGTLSAWCTPQGRVAFQFHVLPSDPGFLLIVPTTVAPPLLQRLRMFVLRAKVTIDDISPEFGVLGLSVPRAATCPTALKDLVATRHALSMLTPALPALCIDDSARFLVCGELSYLVAWWRDSTFPALGSAAWRWLDIQQGHLEISDSLANEYLPQQLNLDMVDALAFDKGCYPGQEVIARLRYRGEVKARLLRGHAAGPVPIGARLQSAGSHTAGRIVASVTLPTGQSAFLAIVELAALPAVRLTDAPTLALSFEHPPYWHH